MKKVLNFIFVLTFFMILTGCDKTNNTIDTKKNNNDSKKIVLKDNKNGYTTTFKNEDKSFKIKNEYQKSVQFAELELENKKLNIKLYLWYFKDKKENYELGKLSRLEDANTSKEYNWNNYSGYAFDLTEDRSKFNIILNEENGEVLALYGNLAIFNIEKETSLKDIFLSDEFQKFINSIKFKK